MIVVVTIMAMLALCLWLTYDRHTRSKRHDDLVAQLMAAQNSISEITAVRARTAEDHRKLLDSISAGVIRANPSGEILAANPYAVELLGYESPEHLLQQNFDTFFSEPARREVALRRILKEGRFRNVKVKLRRRDGSLLYVLMNGYVTCDAQGEPQFIESVMIDVTELLAAREQRDRLEQELRLSQKLQAIGSLTAGIAHEINTPLQFVSDSAYVLKLSLQELQNLTDEYGDCLGELRADPRNTEALARATQAEAEIDVQATKQKIHSAFERIAEGIERVTRIVRAMKEFSHPDQQGRTRADLNHALQTTLEVCRNEYKHLADIETDFGELPPVNCQIGELNQTFVNLIVNAAHAIEKAQQTRPGKGVIRIVTRAEENAVIVIIADSGSGIPESIRHRIFDPFFTTKGVGKGTGQGLALAHAVVVTQHGGEIGIDSTVGRGTTFTIRLPLDRLSADSIPADGRKAYA